MLLDLTWKADLTSALLAECSAAHGSGWGVLVGAYDSELDDVQALVEVSGGGFTYIRGGDSVHEAVKMAYEAALSRGDGLSDA